MKPEKVQWALATAEQFKARAEKWLKAVKNVPETTYGSKEGGDLRRWSMELTRALAEMRKP